MGYDALAYVTLATSCCILLAAVFPQGGISLKMVRVSVPQYTLRGESVELVCEFDLQGDKLYAVSWYKDHDEFYRYVHRGNPRQHTYRIDGIKVNTGASDSQKVTIQNVPLKSSGSYRCEVSAEAPNFSSVHGEARMNVVALPQEGPEISGEERNYQVGDEINLNCTSARSFPPARLRWYVNDEPVMSEYEVMKQQHGLMTATAGLRFRVGPQHFRRGKLQVRCVATISTSGPAPAVAAPAPAPAPASASVLHHAPETGRLAAAASSGLPPAFDYNKEALFSVKGRGSTKTGFSGLLLALLSLALISHS